MPAGRMVFWTLVAATLAVYTAMVVWSLPRIAAEADGLLPFDLRLFGYTEAEARMFLARLSDEGRRFYLDVQHRLDLFYPPLAALVLALSFRWLFWARWPGLAVLLIIAAVVTAGADALENARVADLLRMAPEAVTAEAIAGASNATLVKGVANILCFTALLAGLGWQFRRGRRGRQAGRG